MHDQEDVVLIELYELRLEVLVRLIVVGTILVNYYQVQTLFKVRVIVLQSYDKVFVENCHLEHFVLANVQARYVCVDASDRLTFILHVVHIAFD